MTGSRSGNPAFEEDFQVRVVAWTGNGSGGQAVRLRLSRFRMTADTLLPGPYGLPSDESAPPTPKPRPLKETALSAGILKEDMDLDLAAAVRSHQALISQFDAQRPLAAHAIFRMGECYRRMGRMDEARLQYNRILREFSDQTALVQLCQRYAANVARGTGGSASTLPEGPLSNSPTAPAADEIVVVEWQLAQARNEHINARSRLADGEARLAKAAEQLKRDGTSPGAKAQVDEAQSALALARRQDALRAGEVTRLEAGLRALKQQREATARLNYEQAEANLKRIKEALDSRPLPESELDQATLATEKAAADLTAAVESGPLP